MGDKVGMEQMNETDENIPLCFSKNTIGETLLHRSDKIFSTKDVIRLLWKGRELKMI